MMLGRTHVAFALCVASVGVMGYEHITAPMSHKDLILFFGGVAIGALLPDIDEPQSRIGKATPMVSHAFKSLFGHRGATHTLLFPLAVGAALYFLFLALSWNLAALLGLVLGCYLHIAGDMLTKSGCPIYLPFNKKNIGLLPYALRFRTGSAIDRGIANLCITLFALYSANVAGFELSWLQHISPEKLLSMLG